MEPSDLELDVISSEDQDTSPLGAATSNSEHNPVTQEDWYQARKPSTQVTHRPITRSQSKVRPDTTITADRPSCIASSDTTDEFKADDIWETSMNANTVRSAVSIQADNTTSTLHTQESDNTNPVLTTITIPVFPTVTVVPH